MNKIYHFFACLLVSSIALSQTFVDGNFSYQVSTPTTVTVTGRAPGNTDIAIVIPDMASDATTTYDVTSIGDSAFQNNDLTTVTIPNSVTTIGANAFDSNDLTTVTIPNSVTIIGDSAFQNNDLTSVTIPNNVTSIENSVFRDNALTSVTIPNSVTTIGDFAFLNNSLTSVTIPNSVTTIGESAFNANQLTTVTIPDSVTSIENSAFRNNSLTSVMIPNSVTTIGESAFRDNALTSVTIPDSVTTINTRAFQGNSLTTVTIPNSVTTLEGIAFLFNSLTTVTIGNGVTEIGQLTFSFANPTTAGQGAHSVTFLGETPPTINANSFINSSNTANPTDITVTVPCNSVSTYEGNTSYDGFFAIVGAADASFNYSAAAYCSNETSQTPTITGDTGGMFSETTGNLVIDTTTGVIDVSASPLGTYTVTYTTSGACPISETASVTITSTLFFFDGGFSYLVDCATNTAAIAGLAPGNTDVAIVIPDMASNGSTTYDVTSIADGAFVGSSLTSVTIPNSVTSIGFTAFLNNSLTSVTIPNSVTTIGGSAFVSNNLETITIPDSVTSIEGSTFSNNSLTTVTIGSGVTSIGLQAFNNNSLTTLTIPDSVTTIGFGAFSNNSLTTVTIGDGVTSIANLAFSNNSLTTVTIGSGVTSIGAQVFGFATPTISGQGEHTVTFLGETPPTIGFNSFSDNPGNPNRSDITVTVPCGALSTYTNNSNYTGFFAINCPTTTWNGTEWSPMVPTQNDPAILAGNYNTATDGNLDVSSLEVQDGAILTVADNTFVQTQGNITVNQNGTINVANTGSVVQINDTAVTINNGTITINKTTPSLNPRDFIVLSSPMTAETNGGVYANSDRVFSIISENFTPNEDVTTAFPMAANFIDNNGDYLDNLELDNPNLTDDAVGLDNILNPSEGFLVFPQAVTDVGAVTYDHTYTQGTLNSGNIVASITYNGPTTENNFNLLGNPYPSAIDTDLLISSNTAINEVYFWEHITAPDEDLPGFNNLNFSMDDVSVRNAMMGVAAVNDMSGDQPGQFMASGQGFAILAEQTAATDVTFTNALRITGNNSTPRSADFDNKLWLRLDSETYTIQSIAGIGFVPEATPSFDAGFDSRQLATTISLFSTIEDGQRLSIQGREIFDTAMEINLGFQTLIPETENYTISIDQLEGIDLDQNNVFLIDNALNITTNLKETAYTFTSSKTLQEDRFTLVFNNAVLSTQENSLENSVSLYPNPAQGQIQLAYAGSQALNSITITDILGKRVQEVTLNEFTGTQTIDVSRLQTGLYFFTIAGDQNTTTKRVIIQ